MKRNQSRSGSPTNTVFSGISSYKTDSYRPISSKNAPPVPTIDYRSISKIHFEELSKYLAVYLSKASPETRSTARQKLTRLTIQQFHELSTDVYDELCRRKKEKEVPFLPVREEFHPKRNQARQKLATLPTSRFEDLSSDVYFELIRRYPEFQEEAPSEYSPASNYDDYPSPDFQPKSSGLGRPNSRPVDDRTDNDYGGSRRSEDRRRPSEQLDMRSQGRRSEDEKGYAASMSSRRKPSQDIYAPGRTSGEEDRGYAGSSRRKPSQDTTRSGLGGRRPSVSATSDSTSTANGQSTTAASGMVIPNKSTITEEVIEVPYGRDRNARGSGSTANEDDIDANESDAAFSPMGGLNDLSSLTAQLRQDNDDDDVVVGSPGNRNDEFMDRLSYGRASANSDRFSDGPLSGGPRNGRASASGNISASEDQDRLRRDYEFKIATMQNQITSLQRDLSSMEEKEAQWLSGDEKVRQMEDELMNLRKRTEEQSATMKALNKELDDVRESRLKERDRAARREQEDEGEIRTLREQVETLERVQMGQGGADPELVEQLRGDMDNLFADLSELSRRNDELISEKESDTITIRELEGQLREFRRKYEQAKTELRTTSQLYLQGPQIDRSEDQLPVSPDGGVLDIHITAFLSGIDALLTSGRSNAPTKVLSPMRSVVNAVSAIIDDVRAFERRTPPSDLEPASLQLLVERAEVTLSNLVAATKTHAMSSGMSPVSLMDAAASHVSATVTNIGKTINIRKATKTEQEQFAMSSSSGATAMNGFASSFKSVDEGVKSTRKASTSSSGSRKTDLSSPLSARMPDSARRHVASPGEPSSSPPTFNGPSQGGGSMITESSEDAWAELKPYLEAQTESIVYAIQSVLSGVRNPTPSSNLNENVAQIITIVSSIVAVCNDNLPPASSQQGNELLRELSEQANRLSEVQTSGENTKESRQTMAKSSFAVANAMKALMKL